MFFLFVPVWLNAQDYYTGKDTLMYSGIVFQIENYAPLDHSLYIKNASNHVRDTMIYKRGSCPREYYSLRTGYPMAFPIAERIDSVVQVVFSPDERERYTNHPGTIVIKFALDPDTGSVLETEFFVDLKQSSDKTIYSIPIEKYYLLETKLKQIKPCFIPVDVHDAQMSYCTAAYAIFLSPPTH